MGWYSITTGKEKEPSLCDWQREEEEKRKLLVEQILADEKNERGCPKGCGDYCWPWYEWPDCKFAYKYLSRDEREEERRKKEEGALRESCWDCIEWLEGKCSSITEKVIARSGEKHEK